MTKLQPITGISKIGEARQGEFGVMHLTTSDGDEVPIAVPAAALPLFIRVFFEVAEGCARSRQDAGNNEFAPIRADALKVTDADCGLQDGGRNLRLDLTVADIPLCFEIRGDEVTSGGERLIDKLAASISEAAQASR